MPLLLFEGISLVLIFVLGVILHFTYLWSNKNGFVGLFSAVNESTWEHLKLVFFPTLLFTLLGNFLYQKEYPNYLCAKTKGILVSLAFLVVFFYTFQGVMGFSLAVLNISSFFVSVLVGEFCFLKEKNQISCCNKPCFFILLLLIFSFLLFTYFPPSINLFKDPLTGTFGIQK